MDISDVDELGLDVDPVIPPPEPKPQPPPAEPDPEFFKKIDRAADRIIEREKIQDDYKKVNFLCDVERNVRWRNELVPISLSIFA